MCREPVVMGRKMGLRKAILEITLPDYPVEVVPLPGSPLKSSVVPYPHRFCLIPLVGCPSGTGIFKGTKMMLLCMQD